MKQLVIEDLSVGSNAATGVCDVDLGGWDGDEVDPEWVDLQFLLPLEQARILRDMLIDHVHHAEAGGHGTVQLRERELCATGDGWIAKWRLTGPGGGALMSCGNCVNRYLKTFQARGAWIQVTNA